MAVRAFPIGEHVMNIGTREAAIAEARTWLGTPYHHRARIKGAGVDCLLLLHEVYVRAGVFEAVGIDPQTIVIPEYPADIMLHRSEETYLEGIRQYAAEVAVPEPGNIALWKFGRIYSHAAIIVDWPTVIHAYRPEKIVSLGDVSIGEFVGRAVKFFDPWGM